MWQLLRLRPTGALAGAVCNTRNAATQHATLMLKRGLASSSTTCPKVASLPGSVLRLLGFCHRGRCEPRLCLMLCDDGGGPLASAGAASTAVHRTTCTAGCNQPRPGATTRHAAAGFAKHCFRPPRSPSRFPRIYAIVSIDGAAGPSRARGGARSGECRALAAHRLSSPSDEEP